VESAFKTCGTGETDARATRFQVQIRKRARAPGSGVKKEGKKGDEVPRELNGYWAAYNYLLRSRNRDEKEGGSQQNVAHRIGPGTCSHKSAHLASVLDADEHLAHN